MPSRQLIFFSLVSLTSVHSVGVGLRKGNAATRLLLGEGILASYRVAAPNFLVELEHLYNCANVRDLVKDDMYPISCVTKPQAFKISKDPTDGLVKMQVQARSYKDEWGVIDRYACMGAASSRQVESASAKILYFTSFLRTASSTL